MTTVNPRNIYNLKPNETKEICKGPEVIYIVLRVPNGWVYTHRQSGHSVFVPFSVDDINYFEKSSI